MLGHACLADGLSRYFQPDGGACSSETYPAMLPIKDAIVPFWAKFNVTLGKVLEAQQYASELKALAGKWKFLNHKKKWKKIVKEEIIYFQPLKGPNLEKDPNSK